MRALFEQGRVAEDEEMRTAQLRHSCIDAVDAYEPSLYDGPVLLFRSDAVSDKYERTEDYNWRGVTPNLRIVRVSGDHLVLFDEPWVEGLAEKLRAELSTQRSLLLQT